MIRRLIFLLSAFLTPTAVVSPQAIVGGYAIEKVSGRPLACLDVQVLDSLEIAVAEARTLRNGGFQFDLAAGGKYSLRFGAFGLKPLTTDVTLVEPVSENLARYELVLEPHDSLAALLRLRLDDSIPQIIPGRGRPARMRSGLPDVRGEHSYSATIAYAVDRSGFADSLQMIVLHSDNEAVASHAIRLAATLPHRPARLAGEKVCRFRVHTITVTRLSP